MMTLVNRMAVCIALTVTAGFAADTAAVAWQLNMAKSKTASPLAYKSRTDVVEMTSDRAYKTTRTDVSTDGTKSSYSYTYKTDGKEYPVTGAPFDTISVKQVDERNSSFEARNKAGGGYHQTGKNVVSQDGKTRTLTFKGMDAKGKPVSGTLVFERQ